MNLNKEQEKIKTESHSVQIPQTIRLPIEKKEVLANEENNETG